jgi:hypothetical protein
MLLIIPVLFIDALFNIQVAGKIIPEPPEDIKDKSRWLQCTVKNETQFDILLIDTYFDSGRYWTAPGSFDPFAQLVFSCCNGDGDGVSGGTAFRLSLDGKHYYDVSIVSTILADISGSLMANGR